MGRFFVPRQKDRCTRGPADPYNITGLHRANTKNGRSQKGECVCEENGPSRIGNAAQCGEYESLCWRCFWDI